MAELLERESHLRQLADHLQAASAGHGRLVLVGGEAGVGKTSLVDEFCQRNASACEILRTSCDALSTPGPLGPLRDLAPALDLHVDGNAVECEGRDALFRAVLAAYAQRSSTTVMVGEDAHWADGASLELLRFLARRIGDLRVLFVVTYRDDELGAAHPLRRLLGDLATAATVHRLPVAPLSEAAVSALAAGSGRDAVELYRLTGGNPFFLTEVLAAGEGVPATVEDAVLARAARLSPEGRAALDVAAAIGATVDLPLLMEVAGPVHDEIDECIGAGLLRAKDDSLIFRHQLAREAILTAINPPRRRLLHTRILSAMRERADTADVALLAHHAEVAGDREAVLRFAVAAAEQANKLHAHREAAAQYARALRFAEDLPPAERARLFEAHSVACYLSDQGPDSLSARQEALAIWRQLGDRLQEGDNLRWLSRLFWFEARGDEAENAGAEAITILEEFPPGPELAMAYSNMSHVKMIAEDCEAAIAWGQRAIDLAQGFDEQETLIHALANVGTARVTAGDARGEDDLERSFALARDAGYIDHAARALTNLSWSALWRMRLEEAMCRIATGLAYAIDHDLEGYRWYFVATRAFTRTLTGEWDEALVDARQVIQRPILSPLSRIVALETLGTIHARRGDPEAGCLLDEVLALTEHSDQLMRLGVVRAARAEAALLAGDRETALVEARAVADLAFARGSPWTKGEIAWLLWKSGERSVPRDGLAAPYAHQLAGDWSAAAAEWERLGCPYDAACALAESDDPHAIQRTIATFEHLGARPAIAQAIHRLRELGVRDLPTLRRGPRESTRANPAGLTRREVEVLTLLAEGLRNAEIADRLFLTPKTVSHHVSAILAKIDAETRAEAARAAVQLGIITP